MLMRAFCELVTAAEQAPSSGATLIHIRARAEKQLCHESVKNVSNTDQTALHQPNPLPPMISMPLNAPAATPTISAQLAATDWLLHWLSSPEHLQQWMRTLPAVGSPTPPSASLKDTRYAHPTWQQWPFNALRDQHQAWSDRVLAHAQLEGMQPHHQQLMTFMARQLAELCAPANWPWSNPEVSAKGASTLGMSLLKGTHLWMNDLPAVIKRQLAALVPGDASADATGTEPQPLTHEVGRDVALTPGKVVMRNHLVELIQYEPSTEQVAAEPLLIVPSCIMKYYILDLSPHNSMVKFLRDQGFTVFMLSWRNPDEADRDLGMDDYLRLGLLDSMAAIRRLTGCERLHAMGYCLGGTFLAMVASLLARRHEDTRVKLEDVPELHTLTLLAAQTDFSEPGDLGVFIDPDQVQHLRKDMERRGFLSGRQMATAFQVLNARDLIWTRLTRRYLLGEEENGIDLMSWNADATRLPARMHSEYLHELFLRNALATGHARVLGERVALIDIQCPMLVVGTEKDQVSPWRSVHKVTLLTDTDTTFMLASGGHNAGIITEPGHPHRHHAVRHAPRGSTWLAPDDWLAQAEHREGSWWPEFSAWLARQSSAQAPARAISPSNALADAPGEYVKVRYAD